MFKRRTLFILGAGASAEVKMPCGAELALKISDKMHLEYDSIGQITGSGDKTLFSQAQRAIDVNPVHLLTAASIIRDGVHLANSIDDFLDLHQNNPPLVHLAKAAIAKCILEAEKDSRLWVDDTNIYNTINFRNIYATWFVKFMKVLGKNVPIENAASIFDDVAFIVFNYDRCLEHFLINGVQRLYGISPDDAKSICDDVTILHPYGQVARLRTGSGSGVPFGHTSVNCSSLATNIKTYAEQTLAGDQLAALRDQIQRAQCIVFLGCAFHEPNMLMLTPQDTIKPIPVFSSGFGISDDDCDHVRARIGGFFQSSETGMVRLRNKLKCSDLFDNFSRTITG